MAERYEAVKESVAFRLKQAMAERGMRQVDVIRKCEALMDVYNIKVNKSDLSQYLSGKNEPSQNKIFLLAKVLNVNEAWLLGYDVDQTRKAFASSEASEDFEVLNKYKNLSMRDKKIINSIMDAMISNVN